MIFSVVFDPDAFSPTIVENQLICSELRHLLRAIRTNGIWVCGHRIVDVKDALKQLSEMDGKGMSLDLQIQLEELLKDRKRYFWECPNSDWRSIKDCSNNERAKKLGVKIGADVSIAIIEPNETAGDLYLQLLRKAISISEKLIDDQEVDFGALDSEGKRDFLRRTIRFSTKLSIYDRYIGAQKHNIKLVAALKFLCEVWGEHSMAPKGETLTLVLNTAANQVTTREQGAKREHVESHIKNMGKEINKNIPRPVTIRTVIKEWRSAAVINHERGIDTGSRQYTLGPGAVAFRDAVDESNRIKLDQSLSRYIRKIRDAPDAAPVNPEQ